MSNATKGCLKGEVKYCSLVVCAYIISMISLITERNDMTFFGNLMVESKDHGLQTAPCITLLNSCTSLNIYPLACKESIFFSFLTIGMTFPCSHLLVCFPILNNQQTCWTVLSITSLRTLVCDASGSGAAHLFRR